MWTVTQEFLKGAIGLFTFKWVFPTNETANSLSWDIIEIISMINETKTHLAFKWNTPCKEKKNLNFTDMFCYLCVYTQAKLDGS